MSLSIPPSDSSGYDPIVENIELKKQYIEANTQWQQEKKKLEESFQARSKKLEHIKGRMGRLKKTCDENMNSISRDHQGRNTVAGGEFEYKLDTIYEMNDDPEIRSVGQSANQNSIGPFTPVEYQSAMNESHSSKYEFGRISRFSDASEVVIKNSISDVYQSAKKRDLLMDLFRSVERRGDTVQNEDSIRSNLKSLQVPAEGSPKLNKRAANDKFHSFHNKIESREIRNHMASFTSHQ